MKKSLTRFDLVLFITIVVLGVFLRFYRFNSLINVGYEQALDLNIVRQMIEDKRPAFLGEPYLSRITATSRYFYRSASYLYPLVPLAVVFNSDPLPITAAFTVMNLLSGLLLFYLLRNFFNKRAAFIGLYLFMIDPVMIYYSRMIWVVCFMVPVMTATAYLFYQINRQINLKLTFLTGLIAGFGTGIHLSFINPTIFLFFWLIYLSFRYRQLSPLPFFVLGFILANTPLLIFELRHHFFNTQIMWEYFLGMLKNGNQEKFTFASYHFVLWYPLIFMAISLLLSKLSKRFSFLVLIILVSFTIFIYPHWQLNASNSSGMVSGWNLAGIKKTIQLIKHDQPSQFEVASILDGETRAYIIRYFLDIDNLHPMGVEDYAHATTLYLLAFQNQDPLTYSVWELNVMRPFKIESKTLIQNDIYLYKLIRINQ